MSTRKRTDFVNARRWIIRDTAAPVIGAVITTYLFWGTWWLVLGFIALQALLAWVLVDEDRRELRREQRWQRWVDEHTTIRNDFPKD